jgi:hypothetical protein
MQKKTQISLDPKKYRYVGEMKGLGRSKFFFGDQKLAHPKEGFKQTCLKFYACFLNMFLRSMGYVP